MIESHYRVVYQKFKGEHIAKGVQCRLKTDSGVHVIEKFSLPHGELSASVSE